MKKLTNFRNKYSGRCFIVGNGASLNKTPLFTRLENEKTFGMNMISMIFERTSWRPDFMVVTTTALGDMRYRDHIISGIKEAELSFVWDKFKDDPEVGSLSNVVFIPVIHSDHYEPEDATDEFWPKVPGRGISKFATGTFAILQLAVYMGFNPIYLVGVDLDWKTFRGSNDPNHFDPGYNSRSHTQEKYQEITRAQTRAYEIAKVATDKAGIEIFNATVGGKLEVFPRVRFEGLFND